MMTSRHAVAVSCFFLALPLACSAFEGEKTAQGDTFLSARMLKGKDVGGTDSTDLILIIAAVVAFVGIVLSGGLFYIHHKRSKIDPYKQTLWRYKYAQPIDVRANPTASSKKTARMIMPEAVLRVQDELVAKDGSKHLKLADHSGWIPEQVDGHGQVVELIEITSNAEAVKDFQGEHQGWDVFLNWGWGRYDLTTCKTISAGLAKSLAAVDSAPDARVRTVIDLISMQQINMVTGRRRPIRRGENADPLEDVADDAV